METNETALAMTRAHVLNLLKRIIPLMNTKQKHEINVFLLYEFPTVLAHPSIELSLKEDADIPGEPWDLFKEALLPHTKSMGKAQLFHLRGILETNPEAMKQITIIIGKIKEADAKHIIEEMDLMNINDDCETISYIFRGDTKKASKERGLKALEGLYSMYLEKPGTHDLILGRVAYYEPHIKFLAEDFCEGKTMLPSEDLNEFQLMVRKFRLEAQAKKQLKSA